MSIAGLSNDTRPGLRPRSRQPRNIPIEATRGRYRSPVLWTRPLEYLSDIVGEVRGF